MVLKKETQYMIREISKHTYDTFTVYYNYSTLEKAKKYLKLFRENYKNSEHSPTLLETTYSLIKRDIIEEILQED